MATPLIEQLHKQGFSIIFECSAAQCGGFDFRFALDVIAPPAMFVDLGNYRFVSLRNGDMGVTILASAAQSMAFIQISQVSKDGLIETKPTANTATENPTTTILGKTAAPLAQQFKIHGFAKLNGLSFLTGSTTLTNPRAPALEALAEYLRAHPNQKIALVGHTDSQGTLNSNIALSKKRAEAVLEALVSDFNIPRVRMDAQGMGYLSPIASNLTAQGREANRRVEAIVTSTE
jgi:OOP family OmpA-OmpF porin